MKQSTLGNIGNTGLFARRLRSGAVGLGAALMLATLAQPATAWEIRAPDITVKESETAVFTITLPIPRTTPSRFAYRTENGSAKAGVDYEAKSGHVVFPKGKRRAQVRIETHQDGDANDEHFNLVLSNFQVQVPYFWGHYWTSNPQMLSGTGGPVEPRTKTVRATIIDAGLSYEDEKYGPGYTGTVFGE